MNDLIKSLLERDGLNGDTVITAYHITKDTQGRSHRKCDQFLMAGVVRLGEEYQFRLRNMIGTATITVWARDIVAFDGMDPVRYVDIYDINPDGSAKKIGKKRGRKPKVSII